MKGSGIQFPPNFISRHQSLKSFQSRKSFQSQKSFQSKKNFLIKIHIYVATKFENMTVQTYHRHRPSIRDNLAQDLAKPFLQFWQAKILKTLTSDSVQKIWLIVTNLSEKSFPTLSATSSFIKAGIALHFSVGRGKFQTRLFHQIWQISVSTGRTCRGGKPIRWGPNQMAIRGKYEACLSLSSRGEEQRRSGTNQTKRQFWVNMRFSLFIKSGRDVCAVVTLVFLHFDCKTKN